MKKGTSLNKQKNIVNEEHWQEQKRKNEFCYQHKLSWENALVKAIGKGPFTSPNKALVNTLGDV